MDELLPFIERFGYPLLFALGFLEFAGFPIAMIPVLVAAGALVAGGVLDPVLVVLMVVAGGLLSDMGWFWVARWQGERVVDLACGLSSHPVACVVSVRRRVESMGANFVLFAKFIPGAGNLVAPASGLGRMSAGRFAGLNGIAIFAWAAAYMGLGALFAEPVMRAVLQIKAYFRWAAAAAVAAIVVAGIWRVVKVRMHRRMHAEAADRPGSEMDEAEGHPHPVHG